MVLVSQHLINTSTISNDLGSPISCNRWVLVRIPTKCSWPRDCLENDFWREPNNTNLQYRSCVFVFGENQSAIWTQISRKSPQNHGSLNHVQDTIVEPHMFVTYCDLWHGISSWLVNNITNQLSSETTGRSWDVFPSEDAIGKIFRVPGFQNPIRKGLGNHTKKLVSLFLKWNAYWGIPPESTWNPHDPCFCWKGPCFGGSR